MSCEAAQHAIALHYCLQCFDDDDWAAGRASDMQKTEWWGAGMVICLERGADLHTAQVIPLPLTVSCFSKIFSGTGSPRQSRGKGQLNGCVCTARTDAA